MKKLIIAAAACALIACNDATTDDAATTDTAITSPAADATTPNVGAISDSTGDTRTPGEDTGAIHQNTSNPGHLD